MKGRRIVLTCAIATLTITGGAMASEIYKWTDEEGNVHYEDRPTGARTEERLAMTYSRTNSGAVQQRAQAFADATAAREEARSAAAAAEKEAAEQAADEAQRAERCDGARARLESYLQSRRLYRTDENGEREYLDDTQTQEAREKAEEQVTKFCS